MKENVSYNLDEVHTDNLFIKLKSSLENKGFNVLIIDDTKKLESFIENEIPDESLVGLDGSPVIDELDIPEYLRKNWNVIVDPFQKQLAPEIGEYLLKKLPGCEYYITIADEISMDGKLVFKNKNGFLASCDSEKPENVIAIAGVSNICEKIDRLKFKNSNSTVLEVSPFGLKRGMVDNYGQMEDYNEFNSSGTEKQRNFFVVLLAEELAY